MTVSVKNDKADLATERERQLTTGTRTEWTERDFRCPICRSAIGQASCLVCPRTRQLTLTYTCNSNNNDIQEWNQGTYSGSLLSSAVALPKILAL